MPDHPDVTPMNRDTSMPSKLDSSQDMKPSEPVPCVEHGGECFMLGEKHVPTAAEAVAEDWLQSEIKGGLDPADAMDRLRPKLAEMVRSPFPLERWGAYDGENDAEISRWCDSMERMAAKIARRVSLNGAPEDDLPPGEKEKKHSGYVEYAGRIHCATCPWLKGTTCSHPEMGVEVSPEKGCCNYWENGEAEMSAKQADLDREGEGFGPAAHDVLRQHILEALTMGPLTEEGIQRMVNRGEPFPAAVQRAYRLAFKALRDSGQIVQGPDGEWRQAVGYSAPKPAASMRESILSVLKSQRSARFEDLLNAALEAASMPYDNASLKVFNEALGQLQESGTVTDINLDFFLVEKADEYKRSRPKPGDPVYEQRLREHQRREKESGTFQNFDPSVPLPVSPSETTEVGLEDFEAMKPGERQQRLDRLLDEYGAEQDPARKKQLEEQMRSLKASLRKGADGGGAMDREMFEDMMSNPGCPACGAPEAGDLLGYLGDKAWFRCRDCGMEFSEPAPSGQRRTSAVAFPKPGQHTGRWGWVENTDLDELWFLVQNDRELYDRAWGYLRELGGGDQGAENLFELSYGKTVSEIPPIMDFLQSHFEDINQKYPPSSPQSDPSGMSVSDVQVEDSDALLDRFNAGEMGEEELARRMKQVGGALKRLAATPGTATQVTSLEDALMRALLRIKETRPDVAAIIEEELAKELGFSQQEQPPAYPAETKQGWLRQAADTEARDAYMRRSRLWRTMQTMDPGDPAYEDLKRQYDALAEASQRYVGEPTYARRKP